MDPIVGIDTSQYNWRTGVPFGMLPRLHAKGVRFLIARATIGTTPDPAFGHSRHRGTFRSWVPGGYHYLVEGLDPKAQADAFTQECARTGGIDGLNTALDVEDDNRPPVTNHPTSAAIAGWAKKWKDDHPKHQLGLYSNLATWLRLGNPDAASMGFDFLWQARWYVSDPSQLPPAPPHGFGGLPTTLWQWGSLDLVGVSGNMLHLDGDAFYGSMDDLRALAAKEVTPVTDRPAYATSYNATIAQALKALGAITPATGGPAVVAGSTDALVAATQAVTEQKLGR